LGITVVYTLSRRSLKNQEYCPTNQWTLSA
jgi:hypothetical protein